MFPRERSRGKARGRRPRRSPPITTRGVGSGSHRRVAPIRAPDERRRHAPDLARATAAACRPSTRPRWRSVTNGVDKRPTSSARRPRRVGLRHALAGARAAQADRRDWLAVRFPRSPTAVGEGLRPTGAMGSPFVSRDLRPRSVKSSGRPARWGSPFDSRHLRPRLVKGVRARAPRDRGSRCARGSAAPARSPPPDRWPGS